MNEPKVGIKLYKCDCLSKKTRLVRTQTEIHFIAPAYSYTINNYACALPPLANVEWSAFPECFLPTM